MPPFGDRVSADPSFEEMEKIVCEEKFRPVQPSKWKSCKIMSILTRIQTECWLADSHSRLSILRVKKLLKEAEELVQRDLKAKNLDVTAEMLKLIDEVPERHEKREKAKLAEENQKKRIQDELRRKQQEEMAYNLQYQPQFQYPLQHSPIPHQYPGHPWNVYYPPGSVHTTTTATPSIVSIPHRAPQMYTSTPMSGQNPQQPKQNFQNPNFHCKFHWLPFSYTPYLP